MDFLVWNKLICQAKYQYEGPLIHWAAFMSVRKLKALLAIS